MLLNAICSSVNHIITSQDSTLCSGKCIALYLQDDIFFCSCLIQHNIRSVEMIVITLYLYTRPTTFQLTSGKPWPKTGRPGGQLYVRAQSTLRKANYRAWMIRDRQGRTECQTLALLDLVSSAARSALPLSGSKLICANTSTDASSSKSKDYYYCYTNSPLSEHFTSPYYYTTNMKRFPIISHTCGKRCCSLF